MDPYISVIMPVYNEGDFIDCSLGAVLAQDYPAEKLEVLVVDGMSTDQTREKIHRLSAEHPGIVLRVLENPNGIVPTGLNQAIAQAKGDVIMRIDGHTVIAPDYVRRCVEILQSSGAENVGGRMNAVGTNRFGRAVAEATSSPFGVGGGRFHVSDQEEWVDSVYMGTWPRQVFQQVGLFDEELVRDQDDEFNYRLRAAGGKLLQHPKIKSEYTVRSSPARLWSQYFQYGFWKVRVLQKHPLQMSMRQFVPPAFVLGLVLSALLLFFRSPSSVLGPLSPFIGILALILPALYLFANLSASLVTSAKRGWQHLPWLPLTFAVLHISYGLGFLLGLVRFVTRWGDRLGRVPEWSPERVARVEPLVPVDSASPEPLLSRFFKRAFDLAAASFGLLVLSPFFLFIALQIKRREPGPVFYRGPRIGQHGQPFNIFKFRTLYDRPESYQGPTLVAPDDPRVTPLGRWLRATKLNELPQLWNVLKGEMSMVGPRPEIPSFVKAWPLSARGEVLALRPGITSPASIIYRDEESLRSGNLIEGYLKSVLPHKLRLEQLYVRNHDFLGDLDVIFTTLAALLPQLRGASFQPELLYHGLLSRLTRRYISWFMIDALTAFAAFSVAGLLWRLNGPLELGLSVAMQMAALMALVFSLVNSLMGLGRVAWRYARAEYAFDVALSSLLSTLIVTAVSWLWPQAHFLPTGLDLTAGLIAFLGFLTLRYRERLLVGLARHWLQRREHRGRLGERVLVVGAGECGLLACWLVKHSQLSAAFSVVGMVDDDPRKAGMVVDGHRVFGLTRRIPELVEQMDIGVILFAIEDIKPDDQQRILASCQGTPARLVMIPDLMQMFRDYMGQGDEIRQRTAADVFSKQRSRSEKVTGEI